MNIDIATLITSVAAAIGVVLGFGQWLLSYRLDRYKVEFEATRQSEIQKEVALYLGEKASEREYMLEARKRLYGAIGPLQFQLLMACRDAASRIENYAEVSYGTHTRKYYGKSTLYRLLKPVTLSELIEDQMAYADFSVDPTAIALLKFKKSVYVAFTDAAILGDDLNPNWGKQAEHLFSNSLTAAARSLIIQDETNTKRCLHFHEFEPFLDSKDAKYLAPLRHILDDFTIADKPIFWLRLVYYGYICNEFVCNVGQTIGFDKRVYDVENLLRVSKSDLIRDHTAQYVNLFRETLKSGL